MGPDPTGLSSHEGEIWARSQMPTEKTPCEDRGRPGGGAPASPGTLRTAETTGTGGRPGTEAVSQPQQDPTLPTAWSRASSLQDGDIIHFHCKGYEFEQTLGDSEGQGAWRAAVHGVAKSRTQLSGRPSSALLQQPQDSNNTVCVVSYHLQGPTTP